LISSSPTPLWVAEAGAITLRLCWDSGQEAE
jgi:hypothetical protein